MTEPNTTHAIPPPSPADGPGARPGDWVAALLKAPELVAHSLAAGPGRAGMPAFTFLAVAVACHAVFGLSVGLFAGVSVGLMDLVKAPLIAVCSLLLCFPSLYVFACVSGAPLSVFQAVTLGCSCLAMTGLLLAGLAPVVWLFAVSTRSVPFMVILTLAVWLIAVSFAARYVGKLRASVLFLRQGGIKLWFLILIVVTLQMTTCMRPMLDRPETGWWTGEKQFFLRHFGAALKTREAASGQPAHPKADAGGRGR
jgi:hypothetical protein